MKKSELRKLIREVILNVHEEVVGGSGTFCKCKNGNKMFYCVYNDCAKCADKCEDESPVSIPLKTKRR